MNVLGTNIKKLRNDMNLSQIELSNLLGVSQTSIAHYEKGTRQPSIETLVSMGGVFEVSVDKLIGSPNPKTETLMLNDIKSQISKLVDYLLAKEETKFLEFFRQNIEPNYSTEVILYQLLQPILYDIGTLWEQGEIDEADEHYATNIIRKVVNHLSYKGSSKIKTKKIVSFSISSEKHTIGIEMINTYLESLGFQSIFLGGDIPFMAIFNVLNDIQPDYVFISITLDSYLNSLTRLIKELVDRFGMSFNIVIGGQGMEKREYESQYNNVFVVRNNEELHNALGVK